VRTAGGRRVIDAIGLVSEEMTDFDDENIPEMPAGVLKAVPTVAAIPLSEVSHDSALERDRHDADAASGGDGRR
jgi:hypothetical protein